MAPVSAAWGASAVGRVSRSSTTASRARVAATTMLTAAAAFSPWVNACRAVSGSAEPSPCGSPAAAAPARLSCAAAAAWRGTPMGIVWAVWRRYTAVLTLPITATPRATPSSPPVSDSRGEQQDAARRGEGAVSEQAQVEQRVRHRLLPAHEHQAEGQACAEGKDRRFAKARSGQGLEAVDDGQDGG